MKRTALILIFFAALMALPAAAHAAELAQPAAQANDAAAACPYPIPVGEVVGETIVCGEVTVPENWANPSEQMVNIGYAILKSPNVSPFPDPVVYLEGGPGSSALAGLPFLRDTFAQLREYRDVVIYDQRGNSYSSPLVCPLEIAGQPVETPEVDLDFVPTLDSDIVDLLNSAKTLGGYATAVNCAPYFAEQGVDLTQYSTANSVQDLIALMEALPYAEYNIYGISYGTNVALELFRYYTEHQDVALPALRSAVIDGNVPPNVDTRGGQAYATPNNILRLFAECEADPVCGEAFPDVRARAIALLQQAAETPLEINDETIAADDLRQVMGSAMLYKLDENDPERPVGLGATYLPLMVDELENGITDTYAGLRDGLLPPAPEESAGAASLEDNPAGVLAAEASDIVADARKLVEEIEALELESRRASDALDSGRPLADFFLSELRLGVANLDSVTAVFFPTVVQIALQSETEREALEGIAGSVNPEVAALVSLMSDEDVTTALAKVKEALPTLKSVNDVTNTVITCNDRYNSLNLVRIFFDYQAYEARELLNKVDVAVNEMVACEAWGLTPDGTDLTDAVVSDLPILVSNGSMDFETPVEWGQAAAEGLANAFFVTFTYAQHGASTQFDCGPAVVNTFFMVPDREPDIACADDLRTTFPFVLPADATDIEGEAAVPAAMAAVDSTDITLQNFGQLPTVADQGPRAHASGTFASPWYTVAGGDTLYSIGRRFGLPWQIIANANDLPGDSVNRGQQLRIPGAGDGPVAPPAGAPERVRFAPGATDATLSGAVVAGAPIQYVLGARRPNPGDSCHLERRAGEYHRHRT